MSETTWNYRLLIHEDPESGEWYYALHTVYYTDGKPDSWSTEPSELGGETRMSALDDISKAMRGAALPPLLVEGDRLVEVQIGRRQSERDGQ